MERGKCWQCVGDVLANEDIHLVMMMMMTMVVVILNIVIMSMMLANGNGSRICAEK